MRILLRSIALLCLAGGVHYAAAGPDAQPIIAASCGGCHAPVEEDRWTRISHQRKTPEGWQMTMVRMQIAHKAQFIDPAGGTSNQALRAMVKHFSDTRGLAPSESRPYRYILEQELNTVEEHPSEEFRSMCARCHTGARVALQRRSEEEWRNLVHFHLGQYPTTEYQMMGRDRDWLKVALEEIVPFLSEEFPLQSEAWDQWQATPRWDYSGQWRLLGSMPGRGDFSGTMQATRRDGDDYALELTGSFLDGERLQGSGTATVYTGYEWRASLTVGKRQFRQVLAASEDGLSLGGRMFDRERSEQGLRLRAHRTDGPPQLLAVQPAHLRAGGEARLRLVGTGLEGDIDLGQGLEVLEVIKREPHEIQLRVVAARDATAGVRKVAVGELGLPGGLTVYGEIDRLSVEPPFAVARVGGGGGSQAPVAAIFDAVAWSNGADGKPQTDDDLRIGPVPATWRVQPWDKQAELDEDVRFAGRMDRETGVFTPGEAGPNPQRKYQTNNAGNLKVLATVESEGGAVQGDGHLIVTVQRWNNPPIR